MKAKVCHNCGQELSNVGNFYGCAGTVVAIILVLVGIWSLGLYEKKQTENKRLEKEKIHWIKVSEKEFGEDWPFIVSDGEVACLNNGAVIFLYNKNIYALNETARMKEYASIEPIWRDNPLLPKAKVSLTRIISLALKDRR